MPPGAPRRHLSNSCSLLAVLIVLAPCPLLQAEGNTTIPAWDLDSIAHRFIEMDEVVNSLKSRVSSLEQAVVDIEGVSKMTSAGVTKNEQDLTHLSSLARNNSLAAAELRGQFLTAAAHVKNFTMEVNELQGTVLSVQKSAMIMGSASADLGKKVGELETMMDDLSGKASIPSRTARAEATLQEYYTQAQSGVLDPIVAKKLRGSFVRATERTEALAEDTLRARLGAEE